MLNKIEKAGKMYPLVRGQASGCFNFLTEEYYVYNSHYVILVLTPGSGVQQKAKPSN